MNVVVALVAALIANLASAQSLCRPGEQVVFACKTQAARMVSLCLAQKSLVYRFGTMDKLELEHRDPGPGKTGAFLYYHYFRSGADRASVWFELPAASYEVFSDFEAPGISEAGVRVALSNSSKTVLYRCSAPPKAKWYLIEGKVECSDEAMNACVDPPR